MNDNGDDPKYLAYALGELGESESAQVEAELADNPELRVLVDQCRKTGKLIERGLAEEVEMTLTDKQHETLEREIEQSGQGGSVKWQGRPLVTLAAAAAIIICVGAAILHMRGKDDGQEGAVPTPENTVAISEAPEQGPPAVDNEPEPEEVAERPMLAVRGTRLSLDLPAPQFTGTPKTIKSANLVASSRHKNYIAPVIMIPKGAKNLAISKPTTASDSMPIIGELSFLSDGDKEGTDGSFVELGPGRQYIQVDLAESSELHAIALWHYHSEGRVYHDVVVQVSDDPDFVTSEVVFNNDHDNSSGLGMGKDKEYIETNKGILFGCKGAKGRYIRFYSNGSTSSEMNHYIEAEVYGVKAGEKTEEEEKTEGEARLELELPKPICCG
ncbi:MAG: hypothetical protein QGH15_18130 [Kiritimatiellia bacterium]|jgi:hypothetical protein|nr:hypothetical protein [Kiritimatiellia bacterium]